MSESKHIIFDFLEKLQQSNIKQKKRKASILIGLLTGWSHSELCDIYAEFEGQTAITPSFLDHVINKAKRMIEKRNRMNRCQKKDDQQVDVNALRQENQLLKEKLKRQSQRIQMIEKENNARNKCIIN